MERRQILCRNCFVDGGFYWDDFDDADYRMPFLKSENYSLLLLIKD